MVTVAVSAPSGAGVTSTSPMSGGRHFLIRSDTAARESGRSIATDVTRRLTLLWDPPEPKTRGRRATLTREDVVAAAVALADEGGLDALSMRRVASALNVGAMSLYTYVPGRTELIDLMIDRVYAEMDLPGAGTQWRPALA